MFWKVSKIELGLLTGRLDRPHAGGDQLESQALGSVLGASFWGSLQAGRPENSRRRHERVQVRNCTFFMISDF